MGKGDLVPWSDYSSTKYSCYGAYQIQVKDMTAGKTVVYDEDAYGVSSKTIKFKVTKGHEYRVEVYFWRAVTTATSYIKYKKKHRGTVLLC